MATALFVCLHNAGRSQMSQALFERAAQGRHRALSAGTTPGERAGATSTGSWLTPRAAPSTRCERPATTSPGAFTTW